jgi:hypothetical protein
MQVVGQCRKEGIGLGVQEVLRSRSIAQLAQAVKEIEHTSYDTVEYFDEPFDLTPIQSLYFQRPNEGRGHFNQSFYLQVKQKTSQERFRAAVQQLIARHSMLRARFSHSEDLGSNILPVSPSPGNNAYPYVKQQRVLVSDNIRTIAGQNKY